MKQLFLIFTAILVSYTVFGQSSSVTKESNGTTSITLSLGGTTVSGNTGDVNINVNKSSSSSNSNNDRSSSNDNDDTGYSGEGLSNAFESIVYQFGEGFSISEDDDEYSYWEMNYDRRQNKSDLKAYKQFKVNQKVEKQNNLGSLKNKISNILIDYQDFVKYEDLQIRRLRIGVVNDILMNYFLRVRTNQNSKELDRTALNKVFREMYKVDGSKLLTMPASPERDKLIELYNSICRIIEEEAKKQYANIYSNYKKEMGNFSYEENMYKSMTKQRFFAITAEMTYNNKGVLPICSMSDDRNYYFYAENSKELYIVSKDGNEMKRIQMKADYDYKQDFHSTLANYAENLSGYAGNKRDPKEMMFSQKQGEGKVYKIAQDGSSRYRDVNFDISDKSTNILSPKYEIKANAEYISNDAPKMYFEKDENGKYVAKFNWGRTQLGLEGQGGFGANVSMDYNGFSVSSSPSIGYKSDGAGIKVTENSTEVYLETPTSGGYMYVKETDGQLSSTGIGVKGDVLAAEGKVGVSYDKDKGGKLEVSASTKGPVKITAKAEAGISNINANISTHNGDVFLSSFSPEFEQKMRKDILNDPNMVEHYEEKTYSVTFDDMVVYYRATDEEQAKLITSEAKNSEELFKNRKSANDYVPQKEIVDIDNDFKFSGISEQESNIDNSTFKYFQDAAQKEAKEKGIIGSEKPIRRKK